MPGARDRPGIAARGSRGRLGPATALGLGVCAAACTGQLLHEPPRGHGVTDDDAGTNPFAGGDDATISSPLGLTLAPAAPALCPGQCVDLTARATGGVAPYTYRWGDDVASSGEPRQVCPDATATYTATVTDSSGNGGELARPSAQATASVTVTAGACADGGRLDAGQDGGAPASGGPLPTTGLHPMCTASWAASATGISGPPLRNGNATVAVDPEGNIVAATSFEGPFAIGGHTPQAAGQFDAMMIKLDPQCKIVWTRQFGAPDAWVNVVAVATDAASNVLLAGYFSTAEGLGGIFGVDFGTGRQYSGHMAGFVVKLDPTGKTSWVHTLAPPDTDGQFNMIDDLAVDREGDALFIFEGTANLGPGAQVDGGTNAVFLVKLDPGGNLLFARSSDALAPAPWVLDSVSTASDASIWIAGGDATGTVRVVHLAPDATILSTQVAQTPALSKAWNGTVAVRVGPDDDVVASASSGPGQTGVEWDRWFEGLSPAGAVRWTYPDLSIPGSFIDPAQLVRVDPGGNAWLGGQFTGSLALGPPVGTLTSPGASWSTDAVILGLDGKFVSGGVGTAMTSPVVGDMALAADGRGVVLTGWDTVSASMRSFFVSKLGF